ncbi:fatty acid desaturase [Echinicola vietnamensis]|uniref:Fatty acid desaturase n=1 Tax=Echinicola vietnamensis (strain DSM 17526 / LMG 23754 / KMM 6221) TaxID=926556 RepID=L0FWR2_ECHVK|nr:fatty acid desaturase [Echinicola vietnamensis]AGA77747.1 fatty acid desaturase [Echinicola vietnamensis DSM 17526]
MARPKAPYRPIDPTGPLIALLIIGLWGVSLVFLLQWEMELSNPLVYLAILIQMHLYTGLFITAHDAMHGSVSKNADLNRAIGWTAAILFSYNFYHRLLPKHYLHHRFVATDEDPDYHASDDFWRWYWRFMTTYLNPLQLVLMGLTYWILQLFLPMENLILFWILPAILSTFQLFYFGTYLPHRGEHHNKHKSSTQSKNHFWAFLSCYFFGYHFEHHDAPGTPWWQLWRMK